MSRLFNTSLDLPGLKDTYNGKVRDLFFVKDYLIMVASDRISAFDHILPAGIPFKGQVLNQMAFYFLDKTRHIVPNWMLASPDPNVTIGLKCEPIKLEMIVRGYLAGHAWRQYNSGHRTLCGAFLPNGMNQNDRFPTPIVTPTSKAAEGHDLDITPADIVKDGIVCEEDYKKLEKYALDLYNFGSEMASERGLILVDTKYEFGYHKGEIYLMDEIHTPDSSRYFLAKEYEERQKQGLPQNQLSKEFVREWLMANGFSGQEGETIPEITDEFAKEVSDKYISLYERMTGQTFVPDLSSKPLERIQRNIISWLEQ